jgi:hypothetical protein
LVVGSFRRDLRVFVVDFPPMRFTMNDGNGTEVLAVDVGRLIIAGWTGRDPVALQKHIRELEALGVTPPASTPIFYRVAANRLTIAPAIEVSGTQSGGEVEFVLVQSGGRLYVGVGSDHTDRKVETYSVTVSKQMCDKPLAAELWDFTGVEAHWDELVLRSWVLEDERRVLYQEGPVSAMRAPGDLIERFAGKRELPDGTVMFCGTLAAIGGVRPAIRFEFELEDPVRERRIRHGYDVVSLPIAG